MSALRSIFQGLKDGGLNGSAHARDRLHQFTDNLVVHLDDVIRGTRDNDRFDDAPDPAPRRPDGRPLPYSDPASRPSFRSGVVREVWDAAAGPDGLVRDPNTGDVLDWTPGDPRRGVWDMGHVPGQRYADEHARYMAGELTPAQFRDWYNDPAHYRPELPRNNRGHRFE